MIKVYDSDFNFLAFFENCKNFQETEKLTTGLKTLQFQMPCTKDNLALFYEENYIETADYVYIIKEIELNENDFFTVYCNADIEELSGNLFQVFDCYDKAPSAAYEYCINTAPNWTIDYKSSVATAFTYQTSNITALEAIYDIAEQLEHELWFDTKNHIITVYDTMGTSKGAYFSNELNLKKMVKQSSTYDYATVLYPIGKDGLTISELNQGLPFITDYSYTNKYIEKVWIDEDIDNVDTLLYEAKKYLASIAQPKSSYKLSLAELSDDIELGDTIILVDNIKQIKQEQRVVEITRFPREPSRSTLQISNMQEDFVRTFVQEQRSTLIELNRIKKKIS